ncbi:MAG: STAS domain-containing protein [Victivallaceae bacterium]|nr:STAS domain-containing protein [Victivallaceae bacterium]
MSEAGNILYARDRGRYFLKMTGSLRFTRGRGFDSLLKLIFDDPEVKAVMVDLSEAEYLDSTMLGLLAKAADFTLKKFRRKMTVLSTNPNINYLLDNIGLDKAFIIVKSYDYTPEMLREIPDLKSTELENALTILDAHRQLVRVNASNRAVFKNVIELLEQETKAKLESQTASCQVKGKQADRGCISGVPICPGRLP